MRTGPSGPAAEPMSMAVSTLRWAAATSRSRRHLARRSMVRESMSVDAQTVWGVDAVDRGAGAGSRPAGRWLQRHEPAPADITIHRADSWRWRRGHCAGAGGPAPNAGVDTQSAAGRVRGARWRAARRAARRGGGQRDRVACPVPGRAWAGGRPAPGGDGDPAGPGRGRTAGPGAAAARRRPAPACGAGARRGDPRRNLRAAAAPWTRRDAADRPTFAIWRTWKGCPGASGRADRPRRGRPGHRRARAAGLTASGGHARPDHRPLSAGGARTGHAVASVGGTHPRDPPARCAAADSRARAGGLAAARGRGAAAGTPEGAAGRVRGQAAARPWRLDHHRPRLGRAAHRHRTGADPGAGHLQPGGDPAAARRPSRGRPPRARQPSTTTPVG